MKRRGKDKIEKSDVTENDKENEFEFYQSEIYSSSGKFGEVAEEKMIPMSESSEDMVTFNEIAETASV